MGSGDGGMLWGAGSTKEWPQSSQNLAVGLFAWLHRGHTISVCNCCPHARQNLALSTFSVSHFGHFISTALPLATVYDHRAGNVNRFTCESFQHKESQNAGLHSTEIGIVILPHMSARQHPDVSPTSHLSKTRPTIRQNVTFLGLTC